MLKKKKFLIGGVVIIIAIVFLAYTGFRNSWTYFQEVDEVLAQESTLYGQNIKVTGIVKPGSIVSDQNSLDFSFTITGETGEIPVQYHGILPDQFGEDAEVNVKGVLDASGVFLADEVTTYCPTKYAPEA